MGSTVSGLQSHYVETVYFSSFSSQEFLLVLIWSTLEGWKAELTVEPPSGFAPWTPGLEPESDIEKDDTREERLAYWGEGTNPPLPISYISFMVFLTF